jgi:hypothetical protein
MSAADWYFLAGVCILSFGGSYWGGFGLIVLGIVLAMVKT